MGRQGPLYVGSTALQLLPVQQLRWLEWEQAAIVEAKWKPCPGVMGKFCLPQNSYFEALTPSIP